MCAVKISFLWVESLNTEYLYVASGELTWRTDQTAYNEKLFILIWMRFTHL